MLVSSSATGSTGVDTVWLKPMNRYATGTCPKPVPMYLDTIGTHVTVR